MTGDLTPPAEHVLGPVPSRRLGRSLGVDFVPCKVCTLDCVYCQVGRTTQKTLARQMFAPVDTILAEVREKLKRGPRPNHITLAGSGEPTLHLGLDEIVDGIKGISAVPVAVLTNGTLLTDPAVRRACAAADVVLPSLDAGDEDTFQAVNRPAPGLSLSRLAQGLATFRDEYHGEMWLEVFLIRGVNSSGEQLRKIRKLVERIRPDRVQLNTAVRPTAEEGVAALTEAEMAKLCRMLGPNAEVIADFSGARGQPAFVARKEEVLAMIRRRPVTLDDIAVGLGVHRNEAAKYVEDLLTGKAIVKERRGDLDFLRAAPERGASARRRAGPT